MDPTKYNSQMQTIAYGEAFMAAAKDFSKELREEQELAERKASATAAVALKDFFDDPELERLHGERLAWTRAPAPAHDPADPLSLLQQPSVPRRVAEHGSPGRVTMLPGSTKLVPPWSKIFDRVLAPKR